MDAYVTEMKTVKEKTRLMIHGTSLYQRTEKAN